MFGYFLRRVDKRFHLERSLGTLPVSKDDAVARLEKLFAMAEAEEVDSMDGDDDAAAEAAEAGQKAAPTAGQQQGASSSSSSNESKSNLPAKKEKSALRRYVEVRRLRTTGGQLAQV